jgi:acyl CoA:acetate/3-ketoacid CoA transferase beta subunit
LSNSFWNDLKTYEEEKKMPYITSVEKIALKRGELATEKRIVLTMLKNGVSVEDVAAFTDLSISQVESFAKEQVQDVQLQ